MQCFPCQGYLFFKPLPDETFVCCTLHKETVEDIDVQKGVSPAIMRHGLMEIPCKKLTKGPVPEEFSLLREQGEEYLEAHFATN